MSAFSLSSINRIEYSMIERKIACNKKADDIYIQLERILLRRLSKCRERLQRNKRALYKGERSFDYINCGNFTPTFHLPPTTSPPVNVAAISYLMAKLNTEDLSNITNTEDLPTIPNVRGWTAIDKSHFLLLLHEQSVKLRKEYNAFTIAQLKCQNKVKPIRSRKNMIIMIKEENSTLEEKSLSEIALPIDEEYDWDWIANKTNYRHGAQECQALWKLCLHPSINKSYWSQAEHDNLHRIAYYHNLTGWDQIAQELNTGRTGYQCFRYFRNNPIWLKQTNNTSPIWSKEEEELLKRLIHYYKEDCYIPWGKIASFMENRTKYEIYNKYLKLMEVQRSKGRFLPGEDVIILNCIKDFGSNFGRLMEYLPGRSYAQLRKRYQELTQRETTETSTKQMFENGRKLIRDMAKKYNLVIPE